MSRFAALVILVLSGCAAGKDFTTPSLPMPEAWRGQKKYDSLNSAQSALPMNEVKALSEKWWLVFQDDTLNVLMNQSLVASPTVRGAMARVEELYAQKNIARSFLFPGIRLEPTISRADLPANRPNPVPIQLPNVFLTSINVPLNMVYELDVWGRLRRNLETTSETYKASRAELQTVQLTLTSEVARNYFLLRAADVSKKILERTLSLRKENLALAAERFRAGLTAEVDVKQAETELATVEVQLLDVKRSRAETEFALSALCGENASSFLLASDTLDALPPMLPLSMPSELLKQRPDIAQAERQMAAAQAAVGASIGSLLPRVNLAASTGFTSSRFSNLIDGGSQAWSIGAGISVPIFEGFRNLEAIEAADARYQQSLAAYQQTVLTAFREVETALSNVTFAEKQNLVQTRAAKAATASAALIRERYTKGLVNYIDVVNAERTMLNAELTVAQLLGQRLVYSVQLIKALGGGWHSDTLK
jgi:outer membrane protein, multidrug efflux system